jgi:hypothetical protein
MNDISVELDDFKDTNEAFENQVELGYDEKFKLNLMMRTRNHWRI